MFDPVNEPLYRLDVAGLPDAFEVLAFTGNEAINEPFVFEVDLLINDPTLDLARLLYSSAFLQFEANGNGIHGQLHELVQREHGNVLRQCRVRLGPKLACLGQRFSQRIFSAQSVPQILRQVLKEHGIAGKDWRLELSSDYPPRDFCTQYRESDLQFFQRLCAEERLHYHFEHFRRGHCLVVGDERGDTSVLQVQSGPTAVCQFEVQMGEQASLIAHGQTDLATLRSGQLMPLPTDPVCERNMLWRLIQVEHQGGQHPQRPYSNSIRAVPCGTPLVANHGLEKPRMLSLQRAWIVDPAQAQPDPSRPVAVQFDWLYQGEGAKPAHCWLPVAPELQDAAVSQWRAGAEVVVSFIEGDPDQPLITGLLQRQTAVDVVEVSKPQLIPALPALDGFLRLLQSSEPLVLLCLLPGGGSFSHCPEKICTCRAATLFGQSGAA